MTIVDLLIDSETVYIGHERDRDIASGGLTLTTSLANVTGVSFTAPATGTYLCIASFDFNVTGAGVGNCAGEVRNTTAGSSHCLYAIYGPASTGRVTAVAPPEFVAMTSGDTIVLRANKSINAGTAATGVYTALAVLRVA